jgi:cystathionine gamma-synthase
VLAGAVAGRADLVEAVRKSHAVLGGVVDPHAAYLVLRGMKTLGLRVERQVRARRMGRVGRGCG